jgi:hypothetical protein
MDRIELKKQAIKSPIPGDDHADRHTADNHAASNWLGQAMAIWLQGDEPTSRPARKDRPLVRSGR